MDESKAIEDFIKETIANMVGIEVDDIQNSDSLRDDYQMSPVDLTDLAERIHESEEIGKEIDLVDIDTVEDLLLATGAEVI